MIDNIGTIGCVLLMFTFLLHIYLLYKIRDKDANRGLLSPNNSGRLRALLPFYKNVPEDLKGLKIFVNLLYAVSIILIVIFLIVVNIHQS